MLRGQHNRMEVMEKGETKVMEFVNRKNPIHSRIGSARVFPGPLKFLKHREHELNIVR